MEAYTGFGFSAKRAKWDKAQVDHPNRPRQHNVTHYEHCDLINWFIHRQTISTVMLPKHLNIFYNVHIICYRSKWNSEQDAKERTLRHRDRKRKANMVFISHKFSSKNYGPVLLCKTIFRHWNCFLSRSVTTDRQDGHGLKIGKIGPSFSSLNASPKKIFLAKFCRCFVLEFLVSAFIDIINMLEKFQKNRWSRISP